ncbi:hypothetical protein BJ508DRAFT_306921 [Ascobolus immersus RN42]|uniref:Uncharacterized protein n=1 Tax=Ascobolus immersus RN42 TaxID=1160509 RepID=A0A3N4I663_ASCIM|nr:hypothetical protein BJ508DRAFT_306921 [Ascobolus immersus RN42]
MSFSRINRGEIWTRFEDYLEHAPKQDIYRSWKLRIKATWIYVHRLYSANFSHVSALAPSVRYVLPILRCRQLKDTYNLTRYFSLPKLLSHSEEGKRYERLLRKLGIRMRKERVFLRNFGVPQRPVHLHDHAAASIRYSHVVVRKYAVHSHSSQKEPREIEKALGRRLQFTYIHPLMKTDREYEESIFSTNCILSMSHPYLERVELLYPFELLPIRETVLQLQTRKLRHMLHIGGTFRVTSYYRYTDIFPSSSRTVGNTKDNIHFCTVADVEISVSVKERDRDFQEVTRIEQPDSQVQRSPYVSTTTAELTSSSQTKEYGSRCING